MSGPLSKTVTDYLRRRSELVADGNKLATKLAHSYLDGLTAADGPHHPGHSAESRRLRAELERLAEGLKQGDGALNQILAAIGEEPFDAGIDGTIAQWTDCAQSGFDSACQLGREHLRRTGQPVPGELDARRVTRQEYEAMDPATRRQILRQLGVA